MSTKELFELSAEKAVRELDRKSIESLFKPQTQLELLLRLDLDGMRAKIHEWISDNGPTAMPHRFRPPYVAAMLHAIEAEEFYRLIRKKAGTIVRG